jgi:class 3 adenylate cyclase
MWSNGTSSDDNHVINEYNLERPNNIQVLKDRLGQMSPKIRSSKCSNKRQTPLSSEEDPSDWSLDMECLSSDHTSSSNAVLSGYPYHRQQHRGMRHSSANLGASSNPSSSSLGFNMSNISEDTFAINNTTTAVAARATGSIAETGVTSGSSFGGLTADEVKQRKRAKTDQIVESLVWFSFHTPRAVLEDLISHELDLCQIDQQEEARIKRQHAGRNDKCGSKSKPTEFKVNYLQHGIDNDHSEVEGGMIDDQAHGYSCEDRPRSSDGSKDTDCEIPRDEKSLRRLVETTNGSPTMMAVPKAVYRQSALLFIDLSGFTRLTTLLDLEALSKVINSYFDMIVSEVIHSGGDILKFAGDAIFAEWKVTEDEGECAADGIDEVGGDGRTKRRRKKKKNRSQNALAELNASLASISDLDFDGSIPKLSLCVLSAARCGAAIVKKFSDYQVMSAAKGTSEAMLNVHCGIGVGNLVGLHVGDCKEGPEEGSVELRREFLFLGDPIDQVARAADVAKDGEVVASPEAILSLAFCCKISDQQREAQEPIRLAMRDRVFFDILETSGIGDGSTGLQPYESIRMHCKALNHTALARLHLQMALYVHPVIRGDELGISAAIQAGTISRPKEELERRHRAEAELRSVLTIFIKAIISPKVTGVHHVDRDLYRQLDEIMNVTSRELDRYSGQLRQFIIDDKGVILIATFGLRGSMFPNLVSSHGLPAIFSIHRALKSELKVESRIGATFGKAYCGVVGGVRRHEFAVMGPAVNLAARLMSSKVNKGILVDEEVRMQADSRYAFNSLPPVMAKGYDKPVPILEPFECAPSGNRRRRSSVPFVGRTLERETILNAASEMLTDTYDQQSKMLFLFGESGMGKSYLGRVSVEEIKKRCSDISKTIVSARSTSTETAQRIPLRYVP